MTEAQNNTHSGRSDFEILFYVRAQFIRNKVILGSDRTFFGPQMALNLIRKEKAKFKPNRQINDFVKQPSSANISSTKKYSTEDDSGGRRLELVF